MGASNSRIEDDKALLLCRERKRFVRQALEGRCTLASEHVSYIQSLRNTGTALRKFVEPEIPGESSLYTSTSVTPGPLVLTDKSTSQFSNSSASLLQTVERDSFSPVPSPPNSARFHVNHMKFGKSSSTTVEELPPIPVIAMVKTSTITPKRSESLSDEIPSVEPPAPPGTPPPPETPPWDYFRLFHPIDNEFSIQDGKLLSHGLDDAEDIRRLREEEGIPELEEEGEKASTGGMDDFVDSEDDFDQPSAEPMVQMFKNRIEELDHDIILSPALPSREIVVSATDQQNGEKDLPTNGLHEAETPEMTPSKASPADTSLLANVKETEPAPDSRFVKKDFILCIKEIEDQFLKASDSGREISRMLEANKAHYRPLFTEETAHRLKASAFLSTCFSCCKEEYQPPQEPPSNGMKYLTYDRSVSSRSSSSRNPLGANARDDTEGLSSNLFSSMCMNSGSHASTLNRLYAWERKLYDEVKASGIIRREYDMKCKLLRDQESTGERHYRIDKTRATVKDLHSRIQVAIHRIDSISKRIEEIRDKELQPQLEELIGGLTRMWGTMLDCHNHQYNTIVEAGNNIRPRVSVRSESQRQAILVLEFELKSLCSSFTKWNSAHKTYLQSINLWLLKCVFPRKQKSARKRNIVEFCPKRDIAPPIFVTCRDWLLLLDKLPTKEVADAIKDLMTITNRFLPRQEKGHRNPGFTFALSQKAGHEDELLGGISRAEAPVDWSQNYDSLQSGLVVFFDRLRTLAESSVMNYVALQQSIKEARISYEKGGSR